MPKVSVIMASYNHENYVAEAIESVLSQTYQDFEFIITDDGSIDGTVGAIKKIADSRIKLFCFSKNQGVCAAMNNCIKEAKGEYIALINSDDAWMPEKLEKQVKFLEENSGIGATFTHVKIIDDNGNDRPEGSDLHTKVFAQPNKTRFQWLEHFFFKGNCLCHPSVLIRKHCYEEIGFYDERFAQLPDFDFWIRLCTRYEIYIMPANLVRFRILQEKTNVSANTPKNVSRHFLEYAQVLKNYLNPEILENLVQIFDITPRVDRIGVSMKLGEVENDTAPFFLAMLAQQTNYPAHKYFSFDLLYQLYADRRLSQKIKEKYFFDFSNLIALALEQDVFGTVALKQVQTQLHEKKTELEQSQTQFHEKKTELEQSQTQLHETRTELEQFQTQLHETQIELEQSQTQLHRTETELEQSQTQLYQTKTELEQSQTQLHQSRGVVKRLQSQVDQYQVELEESHSQLQQTEEVLQVSQSQLQQTEVVLQESQAQLHQTEEVLQASQALLHQTQGELQQVREQYKQSQAQLHQTQGELQQVREQYEQSQTQLHQTQGEVQQVREQYKQSQTQLHQNRGELRKIREQYEQSQAQLHQTQGEFQQVREQLDRSQFQQAVSSRTGDGQNQMQYQLLVRDAWYVCGNNDLTGMAQYLQQSLKFTPFSRTETVLNWLESFCKFAAEQGCEFDTQSLTNSEEWKQLMRRNMAIKVALTP
jgi:glycosyltransferase involved in cell wall biosynthesis